MLVRTSGVSQEETLVTMGNLVMDAENGGGGTRRNCGEYSYEILIVYTA